MLSDSATWTYRSPFYAVTISLDYPFFGTHNVTNCYNLSGWNVQDRLSLEGGVTRATLTRPFGESALLLYNVFDHGGSIPLGRLTKLADRVAGLSSQGKRSKWQLQLIVSGDYGLAPVDIEEITERFVEVRRCIHGLVLEGTSGEEIE